MCCYFIIVKSVKDDIFQKHTKITRTRSSLEIKLRKNYKRSSTYLVSSHEKTESSTAFHTRQKKYSVLSRLCTFIVNKKKRDSAINDYDWMNEKIRDG